jgi:uncharacterized membrane protein
MSAVQTLPANAATPPSHPLGFIDPRRAVGRLMLSGAAGLACGALIPASLGWAVRGVGGWCISATLLLVLAWRVMIQSDVEETRVRCATDDPGRLLIWVVVVVGCSFSLFAAAGLMQHSQLVSHRGGLLVALCLWAVACAWCLTHSAFTLRYAHLYYRDDGNGEGGLEFPGKQPPDDLDFAYFSFTIGTCFQTSDVSITERVIRRTVLLHGVISFAFNTAILALALNLAFGRLG